MRFPRLADRRLLGFDLGRGKVDLLPKKSGQEAMDTIVVVVRVSFGLPPFL
jgi:hypothetical protein